MRWWSSLPRITAHFHDGRPLLTIILRIKSIRVTDCQSDLDPIRHRRVSVLDEVPFFVLCDVSEGRHRDGDKGEPEA